MSQLAHLQTSARTQQRLPPLLQARGTCRGAEATDAAPWGGSGAALRRMLPELPKHLGFAKKLQPEPWRCRSQALAPPLAPLLPDSPLPATARAFPSVSSCTIWALFTAERPIFGGHLMITSNFSTEFPALLQPYDSTTEQGPRAARCNPASRPGPAPSPLIPRVLSLPFARGEPVGLGWGFFSCFRVVCSIFQGLNETDESVTSQLFLFFTLPSFSQLLQFL